MIPKPIYDKLLVEELPDQQEKYGKIHLPHGANSATELKRGRVVAVGEGLIVENGSFVPLRVRVGDTVAFIKSQAYWLAHEGRVYGLIKELYVQGILEYGAENGPDVTQLPAWLASPAARDLSRNENEPGPVVGGFAPKDL